MFFNAIEQRILDGQLYLKFFPAYLCLKQLNHNHYFQELR